MWGGETTGVLERVETQLLGVPGSLSGVDLVLVSKETTACGLQGSILYTSSAGRCSRNAYDDGNCSNNRKDRSVAALNCRQERYHQKENGVGYVSPEQIHSVSKIQNDYNQSSQTSNFGRGMDGDSRLEECILACSDSPQVSTITGVQNRESILPVHRHAFWSQHSTLNLHQAMFSDRKGAQAKGHTHLCIPGRLDSLGPIKKAMPPSFGDGVQSDRAVRLHHQSGEVSLHPIINQEKSVFTPTQVLQWLGLI